MKFFVLGCLIGLGLGISSMHAEDKKDHSDQPSLQALFAKTPEQKARVEALIPTYPLKTCVISGDDLGGMGETVNTLYGEKLVRFCCKGCVKSFNKNPGKYLPKLDSTPKPAS